MVASRPGIDRYHFPGAVTATEETLSVRGIRSKV